MIGGHIFTPCNIKLISLNFSTSGVLILGCMLVLKIMMLRLHPKPGKAGTLGAGSRHQNFKNLPGDYNVQPGLRASAPIS